MNKEKEARAIQYLRSFEPMNGEPYYACYSGGKDSDCIRILCQLAGVNHELHNHHTTADAPETVRYIRTVPGVIVDKPPMSMWDLIAHKKTPPTRLVRYCCEILKERGGKGRIKVTGVRWAESTSRKRNQGIATIIGRPAEVQKKAEEKSANFTQSLKGGIVLNTDNDASRRVVESCYRTTSTLINPIIDWTDEDVWEFLKHYGCESNPLYQCGYKRVGCIGCPLASSKQMKREFKRYPAFRKLYVHAFDRMLIARRESGLSIPDGWTDGEAVMRWWVGDDPRQITLDDMLEEG